MSKWLRTDEAEEAIAALESFVGFLRDTEEDVLNWRWAIISLHIATQGFMVVALRDSAGLTPLRDDVASEWLRAYRAGEKLPKEKLDSYRGLYKKVKRKQIAAQLQAEPFQPKGRQGESILRLCDFRDRFIHFVPSSWSLEVDGLPRICGDVLGFVDYLAHRYRWIIWHEENQPTRIKAALSYARVHIDRCS